MKKRLLTLVLLAGMGLSINSVMATSNEAAPKTVLTSEQKNESLQRTLWGAKASPYVRKVIVTLEEKKIPYTLQETFPTKLLKATGKEVPAEFAKISPFGKIPAYEEVSSKGEKPFNITDSAVIADYINATNNTNPLRPESPKENARVSWFIKYGDDTLAPVTHTILVEKVVKPTVLKQEIDLETVSKMLKEELPPILDFLEKTLEDNRTWIAQTKNLSLADITIVSHLTMISTSSLNLEEVIGANRPHLLAYVKKALDRPSFKVALS